MVTPVSKLQLKLDFDAGLTAQFRTLKQCVLREVEEVKRFDCSAGALGSLGGAR